MAAVKKSSHLRVAFINDKLKKGTYVKKKEAAKKKAWKPNYPHFKFTKYDPIVDSLDDALFHTSMTMAELARESGVSASTLSGWAKRRVMSPRCMTASAALGAMGYELRVVKKGSK